MPTFPLPTVPQQQIILGSICVISENMSETHNVVPIDSIFCDMEIVPANDFPLGRLELHLSIPV